MPPKGAKQPPARLGNIRYRRGWWLVEAEINGHKVYGPERHQKADAEADLLEAQTSQTQEEYRNVLLRLQGKEQIGLAQAAMDGVKANGPQRYQKAEAQADLFEARSSKTQREYRLVRLNQKEQNYCAPAVSEAYPGSKRSAASSNDQREYHPAKLSRFQSPAKSKSNTDGVIETLCGDVAQSADETNMARSPMVFLKVIEPIWATEVADGLKMFECIANKKTWQNQFKRLCSGDIFIVVVKRTGGVAAVCEVASTAAARVHDRAVLTCKLRESLHPALDAYLGDAESFDYVEFKHVFDCRSLPPASTAAGFLELVGLALPRTPLVGLLQPVVLDAQWHSRLLVCMQQAILRGPASTHSM